MKQSVLDSLVRHFDTYQIKTTKKKNNLNWLELDLWHELDLWLKLYLWYGIIPLNNSCLKELYQVKSSSCHKSSSSQFKLFFFFVVFIWYVSKWRTRESRTLCFTVSLKRFSRPFARVNSAWIHSSVYES